MEILNEMKWQAGSAKLLHKLLQLQKKFFLNMDPAFPLFLFVAKKGCLIWVRWDQLSGFFFWCLPLFQFVAKVVYVLFNLGQVGSVDWFASSRQHWLVLSQAVKLLYAARAVSQNYNSTWRLSLFFRIWSSAGTRCFWALINKVSHSLFFYGVGSALNDALQNYTIINSNLIGD